MPTPNAFAPSGKFRSRREWIILFSIGLVGTALSIAIYYTDMTTEESINKINFEMAANRRLSLLKESINDFEAAFSSLQNFYYASDEVTRKEFDDYAARMLKQNPGLQALEWVPKVTNEDLSRFIDEARRDGFPDFDVKQKDSEGKFVKRQQQEEYFPVHYVEPFKGNETALGFDAASDTTRRANLDLSRDTGEMIATEQVRLGQEKGSQSGFVFFVPVYLKGPSIDIVEERRKNIQGFYAGVFRTGDFFSRSFQKQRSEGVNVCVYELEPSMSEQLIHCRIVRTRSRGQFGGASSCAFPGKMPEITGYRHGGRNSS
jgi:CHASE1-domain containing sensor protein